MAAKLLITERKDAAPNPRPSGSGLTQKPMNRESQARFVAVLLFLATVAAVVLAAFNFQKRLHLLTVFHGYRNMRESRSRQNMMD